MCCLPKLQQWPPDCGVQSGRGAAKLRPIIQGGLIQITTKRTRRRTNSPHQVTDIQSASISNSSFNSITNSTTSRESPPNANTSNSSRFSGTYSGDPPSCWAMNCRILGFCTAADSLSKKTDSITTFDEPKRLAARRTWRITERCVRYESNIRRLGSDLAALQVCVMIRSLAAN